MSITGGCLCGEITYEVTGTFLSVMNCHCSRCRRAHGAAFASYAEVSPDQFRFVSGEQLVGKYGEGIGGHIAFVPNVAQILELPGKVKLLK